MNNYPKITYPGFHCGCCGKWIAEPFEMYEYESLGESRDTWGICDECADPGKEENLMSQVMNTKELAEYLKMNPATIRLHAENKAIPGIRIGRVWRFHKTMIDKWFENKMKGSLK